MNKLFRGLLRISSLKNNYLSLVILAVLLTTISYGQYDSTKTRQPVSGYGFDYKNIKLGTIIIGLDTPKMALKDSGAIAYKNQSLWTYTGAYWRQVTGSLVVGHDGIDSLIISNNGGTICSWTDNTPTCYDLDKFYFAASMNFDFTKLIHYNFQGIKLDSVDLHYTPLVARVGGGIIIGDTVVLGRAGFELHLDSSFTFGGGGGTTADSTLTATAAQTAFTFTSVPASYSDYMVFVNGAIIEPVTYYSTLSNVITFTAGLIAGDKVRYHRTK